MTERERLSEAGKRRRVEMLAELQGELARVKRVRARREVVGGGVVALVACAVVGVTLNALRSTGTAPTTPTQPVVAQGASGAAPPAAPPSAAPTPPRVTIAIVGTDPNILRHFEARPRMDGLKILDDSELLQELRATGRDCGLVKMEGRAWLTCDIATPGTPDPGGVGGG